MKKSFAVAALLALVAVAGFTALTGCLDPHETHEVTRVPAAR